MNASDRPLVSVNHLGQILGVSPTELRRLAKAANGLYSPFQITKRNGSARQIDNPCEPLKAVQRRIKQRILDRIAWPDYVCGSVARRSTRDHAKRHVRQHEVVVIDIKDFFPRVTSSRVASLWRAAFGASRDVRWILTRLTTWNGHLPQGAPSSSALANLAILEAAKAAADACKQGGCRFSIYVDDLTISGANAKAMIPIVCGILSRHDFIVNRQKVSVMPASSRQKVGGLVVNRGVSNGRQKIQELRRELATILSNGAHGKAILRLRGKIAHARWASPGQSRWLEQRFEHEVNPKAGLSK